MLNFHPSAKENFDRKAEALLELLREIPRNSPAKSPSFPAFPNEVPVKKIENTSFNIKGIVDYKGRFTERHFEHNGIRVGLQGADYDSLVSLAESIQRLSQIRDKLSQQFCPD